uniref:Innexin n=1 Tax=Plectus sambesii TaxID=2011161 RepID=A0A914WC36_9BILA
MSEILEVFLESTYKSRYEEDSVDRLNYRITGLILVAAALTITAKSYVGEPIQCWVPAHFEDAWEQYVENYCFVENTYWVKMENELPNSVAEREQLQLSYYQWVPFLMILQAVMFSIPHIIWRMLNCLSGIQVRSIITMATSFDELTDAHAETIEMIARHLKAGLQLNAKIGLSASSNPFVLIARSLSGLVGAYITIAYMLVKLLSIVNCILQFSLLNGFLGTQYKYWGAEILTDLVAGRDWFETGHFPRVTMCDLEVRQLGNIHRWSIQCVLMINLFNEKIYLFLWWWFLIVTLVTIQNFIYWLVVSSIGYFRRTFLKRMLNASLIDIQTEEDEFLFNRFANDLVGSDGVVVLRLLTGNAGEIVGSCVVRALWNMSKDELRRQSAPDRNTVAMLDEKYRVFPK